MIKRKNFITIGTFDGIHAGHRFLFNRLETLAAKYLVRPLTLYFPLPPKTLLSTQPEMTVLSSPKEKQKLFKELGVPAQPLDFENCRNLSPKEFFNDVLIKKYRMGGLLVGPDFAFGKDREGSLAFLRAECKKRNIPFEVANFYLTDGEKISSSLIRKTLALGNISQATEMLTRPYQLTGIVIKGHQLGRKIGFPTANMDTGIYKILPLGVFAVKVKVGKKIFNGFCNIGFRPTVNPVHAKLPLVEVNIFNFKKSIYGRKITVYFVGKIRNESKFDGLDALVIQLKKDREKALELLNSFDRQ